VEAPAALSEVLLLLPAPVQAPVRPVPVPVPVPVQVPPVHCCCHLD